MVNIKNWDSSLSDCAGVVSKVIPMNIEALGALSQRMILFLAKVGADRSFETVQNTANPMTAQI